MELRNKVTEVLDQLLEKREDLFLIKMDVDGSGKVHITLDGDNGVLLADCIWASRQLERQLDEEGYDFSLEVGSAGATEPLTLPRQYQKNIGRKLKVVTEAETFEGDLTQANEDRIELNWKQREPKPVGKGKHTVEKTKEIEFNEIKKATVVLKF